MTPDDATSLAAFFAAWELFREPALAGALAGMLLGLLGVYVVLRRMVFLSAALSQSAGLGVTVAFFLHAQWELHGLLGSPTVGALVATLIAALLLVGGRRRGRSTPGEARLGLAYLVGAAGALALGTRIVQESQDIHGILFGSAVAVLPRDFTLLATLTALVLLLHWVCMRGFVQVSFDRDGAHVRGLPIRLLDVLLITSVALSISVCTRVLGALPVFAFSVLPAMAAIRLSPSVPRALWLAAALGSVVGFGGYLAAFAFRLPVGASQALLGACTVGVAEGLRRLLVGRRAAL